MSAPAIGDWTSALQQARYVRLKTWLHKVAEFGLAQAIVQLLMAGGGLIIIRSLSREQYALYAITNSMQSTANLLADLGIGIGIRSIGGRVWNDRARLGQLLTSALSIRHKLTASALAVVIPLSVWALRKNHASFLMTVALCSVILISVLPQMATGILILVPQLHGEYRWLQKLELGNAAARIAILAGLSASSITAVSSSLAGAVISWSQLIFLRRFARSRADGEAAINAEDHHTLVTLSIRTFPNVMFFCFQAQITIFILSATGNPGGIADITALGRLTAMLTVLAVTFNHVLIPAFSRCQDATRLPRLYVILFVGALLSLTPPIILAELFPAKMLWLLGSNYASLQKECVWIVASGCVAQLAAVVWGLNCARAWIRFQSVAFIPAIVCVQAAVGYTLNLKNFHNVVLLNLLTGAATLAVYLADSIGGLRAFSRERRNPELSE